MNFCLFHWSAPESLLTAHLCSLEPFLLRLLPPESFFPPLIPVRFPRLRWSWEKQSLIKNKNKKKPRASLWGLQRAGERLRHSSLLISSSASDLAKRGGRKIGTKSKHPPPPLASAHAAPRSAAPPPWHLSHLVHSAAEVPVSPAGARQPEFSWWPVESPSWTTPWEDEKALGSIRGRSAVRERESPSAREGRRDYPGDPTRSCPRKAMSGPETHHGHSRRLPCKSALCLGETQGGRSPSLVFRTETFIRYF